MNTLYPMLEKCSIILTKAVVLPAQGPPVSTIFFIEKKIPHICKDERDYTIMCLINLYKFSFENIYYSTVTVSPSTTSISSVGVSTVSSVFSALGSG